MQSCFVNRPQKWGQLIYKTFTLHALQRIYYINISHFTIWKKNIKSAITNWSQPRAGRPVPSGQKDLKLTRSGLNEKKNHCAVILCNNPNKNEIIQENNFRNRRVYWTVYFMARFYFSWVWNDSVKISLCPGCYGNSIYQSTNQLFK